MSKPLLFIAGIITGLLIYWSFDSGLVNIRFDAAALPFGKEANHGKI